MPGQHTDRLIDRLASERLDQGADLRLPGPPAGCHLANVVLASPSADRTTARNGSGKVNFIAFTRFVGHGCNGCHKGGIPVRLPCASARGSPARGLGWPARAQRAKEANTRSGLNESRIEIKSKKKRRTRAFKLWNCVLPASTAFAEVRETTPVCFALGRASSNKASIAGAFIYQYSMLSLDRRYVVRKKDLICQLKSL
jgi:hypothetical protein